MGFASDGVSMVGGVSPVGQGRAGDTINSQNMGNEPSRAPLQPKGIQPQGATRPLLQVPVIKYPWEKPHESAPSISTMFGKVFMRALNFLAGPEPTRKGTIKGPDEAMPYMAGVAYADPRMQERFHEYGTSEPGQEGAKEVTVAWDGGPQPIMNMPVDGMQDDATKLVQGWDTNEHMDLAAYRTSFPASSVNQAPAVGRNIILKQNGGAGSFLGEMNIPDGSVTARFTWTTTAGVAIDLWWSLTGQAFIPVGTNQPAAGITQADVGNDTLLLNPDPTTRYLVKGKRAVSFATAVACSVHGEFYMQA